MTFLRFQFHCTFEMQKTPFLRKINRKLLESYYTASDFYLQSSNIETWCFSVTEALHFGKPVVASSVGGMKEQIRGYNCFPENESNAALNKFPLSEANGILFNRGDVSMLAKSIQYLCDNKIIMDELGNNAYQSSLDYTMDKVLDKHLEYYKSVL